MEFFTSFDGGASTFDKGAAWLKGKRFRIRYEDGAVSAEKGYLRETGNLLFHLSLILFWLASALVRSLECAAKRS
jgi:cytochrome c biogenesis protein